MFIPTQIPHYAAICILTVGLASCTLPAPETVGRPPVIVTERPAKATATPTKSKTTPHKTATKSTQVIFDSIRTTSAAGTDYDVVDPKGQFVQVDLTISNNTTKPIPAPASAYKLQLTDGSQVRVDQNASNRSHILSEPLFDPIKSGQTSTRTVFFDIPKDAEPKTVNVLLDGVGHMKFVTDATE